MASASAQPTVLVLMGGPDAEREVSIMSGTGVAQALRNSGRFHIVDRVIDQPSAAELAGVCDEIACDVIFPVLHGHWGEGGPLQELLEQVGLPYVGSDASASALAMDKIRTKAIVSRLGAATPPAIELPPDAPCSLTPPVVLKPIDDGSSVDLRICRNAQELAEARAQLHPRRPRLMAERYVAGREVTVGILLGEPLPLIEILPATDFYDYEAKYTRDDTAYAIDPILPEGAAEVMTRTAMLAFSELGCRDIARVDFMVEHDTPWFLEINTMPGFTSHSLVPMAAAARGMSMEHICVQLVRAASARRRAPAPIATGT